MALTATLRMFARGGSSKVSTFCYMRTGLWRKWTEPLPGKFQIEVPVT